MQPIATAIVGVSGFGRTHYQDLVAGAERGVLRPVAACIINQTEEAEKCAVLRELGATLYDDFATMLAERGSEIELVQIPTGIPLHRPMCVAALEAGANVLVEKPQAGSIADGEAIRDARDAAGKIAAVGFQRMYDPAVWALKQALLAGEIGRIEAITGYGLWPRPRSYYDRNGWAGRLRLDDGSPVLDSPIQNAMAHYVMLALFFGGSAIAAPAELERVEAELARCNQIESADTCALRATTPEGPTISFCATHACGVNEGPTLRIRGSAGSAEWCYQGNTDGGRLVRVDGSEQVFSAMPNAELRVRLIDQLAAAIRGDGTARICTVDQALAHTRLIDAVHRAAAVQPVDPAHFRIEDRDGSTVCVLAGVDELLRAHLDDGRLPSEAGVPWAASGGAITV